MLEGNALIGILRRVACGRRAFLLLAIVLVSCVLRAEVTDLIVYGATPGGIAAAVQAKRMGCRVLVLEPSDRIGGLTTGGLGQTDIGNKNAFGGIAREFYRDIAAHYRKPESWRWEKRSDYVPDGQCAGTSGDETMWTFEPSAAQAVLADWERRADLRIVRRARLDRSKGGVQCRDGRIVAIRTLDGTVYEGRMFVDATYEGDLIAAAGVRYIVGRESNARYGETLNGMQPLGHPHHNFDVPVDPYVVKGDPASGLLPGIESEPMGRPGEGDRRVQAYCLRMTLTDHPVNRIPFAKPDGYDELDYELLFRYYEGGAARFGLPWINSRMPNRKTDTNNRCGFSSDFIGQNHAWPDASYEVREKIFAAHLKYQQGLMWTLANHPRIPGQVRDVFSKWGLCRDEFTATDGWTPQLYVREARRMIGDYVMTEANCVKERTAPCPVALAAYQMDSHHVRRYVTSDGHVRNEGDVEVGCSNGPFGIDYGAIVPKRGECANLLVPVCLSASHIAFGSIRMEPVFFALGQAAGTAAALSIDDGCAVQDLDYGKLRRRLLADGQRLPPEPLAAHPNISKPTTTPAGTARRGSSSPPGAMRMSCIKSKQT